MENYISSNVANDDGSAPNTTTKAATTPMLSMTSVLAPRPTAWMVTFPPAPSYDNIDDRHPQHPLVALIEGYCGASDRPPTLMVGSDSISPAVLDGLRVNKVCTLSVATERDIGAAKVMAAAADAHHGHSGGSNNIHGPAMTFDKLGLRPSQPPLSILDALPIDDPPPTHTVTAFNYFKRPPAVDSSPVQMHCRLAMEVPLLPPDSTSASKSSTTMILLQIDTYIIQGKVLRTQSILNYPQCKSSIQGNPDVRSITAKIDCLLLRPLGSLGNGRFGRVTTVYHMGRPRPRSVPMKKGTMRRESSQSQKLINSCKPVATMSTASTTLQFDETTCNNINWECNSMWEIDDLIPAYSIPSKYDNDFEVGDGQTISYTYRNDNTCLLGYNPMKQVVCPRFIGWISTYEPASLKAAEKKNGGSGCDAGNEQQRQQPIAHISPYSFCIDVARGARPMVAFAACPRTDEFADSDDDDDSDSDYSDQVVTKKNDDSNNWKDAQRDAEATGVFCVNLVSEEMAWAMNASAAPLGKGLSEFRLMNDDSSMQQQGEEERRRECSTTRIIPTPLPAPQISAPYVDESPMFMECRYVKTVKIPNVHDKDSMYSLIIGEVVNMHVRKDVLIKYRTDAGREVWDVDIQKMRPVARLGYGQEYTVITKEIV